MPVRQGWGLNWFTPLAPPRRRRLFLSNSQVAPNSYADIVGSIGTVTRIYKANNSQSTTKCRSQIAWNTWGALSLELLSMIHVMSLDCARVPKAPTTLIISSAFGGSHLPMFELIYTSQGLSLSHVAFIAKDSTRVWPRSTWARRLVSDFHLWLFERRPWPARSNILASIACPSYWEARLSGLGNIVAKGCKV